MNADKRGDNKFVQLKRNEFAALYRRFDMDGRPLEFEVFMVKVAGGKEIFGNYYDPYEQYPGASAFGRTAWSTPRELEANRIFDELTQKQGSRKSDAKPKRISKSGSRGRPRVERPAIILPKNKFCMKELVAINPDGWTQPTLYIELMKLKKQKKVVEAERKNMGGKGRATVFYRPVKA